MFKNTLLFSSSLTLALAVAMPATAQDVSDEIIVTATKRQTTLQQTPVAVTVTDALTIDRAKILDVSDLQSIVPSLRVNQLQSSQNTNFIIRGSGNGANNGGIEGSVGVFVDGVYRSRSSARVNDLPKLTRVEVLKGPQSTLFGKNASSGVISVVTAEPSYETEGYAEATYGNYNQMILKGYGSTGISDTVAVSLGGSINKRDGYFENANPNLSDTNDRNRWNVRGQALFEPNDDMKFRLIGDYSTLDEKCCGVANVVDGPVSGIFQALSGLTTPATAPVSDPFTYVTYQNSDSINEIDDYGLSFHGDIDLDGVALTTITSYRSNDSYYLSDADYSRTAVLDGVSSTLGVDTFTQELRVTSTGDDDFAWMLGGFYFDEIVDQGSTLDYGAALRPYIGFLAGDQTLLGSLEAANGFAAGTFASADVTITETFRQENTAWSIFGTADMKMGDRLTLTGGLNYTNDAKDVRGSTDNPDEFSNLDLAGEGGANFFAGAAFLGGIPGIPSFESLFNLPFSPENAFFIGSGQAGAAAAQGFAEYNALVQGFATGFAASPANPLLGLQGFQTQPQFVDFPNSVESGQTRDGKLTWQARAAYELNDNTNVYASVGTGFKASSWNLSRDSRPFASDFNFERGQDTTGLLTNNVGAGTRYAGPEKVTNYELGIKNKFDGGFLNIALFNQQFKGLQTNAFVGTSFVLTNAGDLRIRGVELDGKYELADGLDLVGALTFLDPVFTDFRGAPGPTGEPIDRTGERPDNVSKLSLSLGGTYNFDLSDSMDAYIRGDWQYESPTTQARNLTPDSLNESATVPGTGAFYNPEFRTTFEGYEKRDQSLFNASAGVNFDNGFGLQVWGKNLFNDQYLSTLFPGVFQFGVVNGYPSAPRMYGLTGRYDF